MPGKDNNQQPIIIKKKKSDEHGHHGGAWKVAYADFVTAMMALFIVLWVLNQDQSMREAMARYFKDPIGFSAQGKAIFDGSSTELKSESEKSSKEAEADELKKMGEKIISELSSNPEFVHLTDQIEVEIVDEGLRIELIDSSDVFFEIGTSTLKENAKHLLSKIGNNLSKLENKIIIEGHTDSRPFVSKNQDYTNFELSAERANSARRALTNSFLEDTQIDEIRGYADRRLRDQTDAFNIINRRISIIVKFSSNEV